MAKATTPKYTTGPDGIPFGPGHPLYDPVKDDEPRTYIGEGDPGQGFNFSDFMTAADAEELFRNMDTGQIEANVLQKMSVPDFLTNTQVQDAINQALGATDFLSEEDIARMIAQQGGPDLSDYVTNQDISSFVSQEQIQQMIANAQMQGMTEEQIMEMIKQVTGGQMSDDAIRELIAEAVAGAGGLTEQQIQQMIDAAMGGGMTAEQIQDIIAQQGYLTEDQIKAMMGESGYLGEEGVNSAVQAALDAALGEGGSINAAIAAAMQNTGGGTTGETTTGETTTGGTTTGGGTTPGYDINFGPGSYTPPSVGSPYGGTDPFSLMLGPFAGMTPFAGGTTTGAENPYGIAGLDIGNTSDYSFNVPNYTQPSAYPSGIDPSFFIQPPSSNKEIVLYNPVGEDQGVATPPTQWDPFSPPVSDTVGIMPITAPRGPVQGGIVIDDFGG